MSPPNHLSLLLVQLLGHQATGSSHPVKQITGSLDGFHGRVVGLQDVVTFQGRSLEELRREMAESVEDYLELCAEAGKDPEEA